MFGLDVGERVGRYAFLTWGQRHHDVALQAVGEDAPGPGTGVGLYHAAIETDDEAALADAYDRLRERGVRVSLVNHGSASRCTSTTRTATGWKSTLTRGRSGTAMSGRRETNRSIQPRYAARSRIVFG